MKEIIVDKITFQIDYSQPIYEQVTQQIRNAIARGELQLGDKIPSVRELAQLLQINPNTVMRAYQELDRDGLIETRRGQGTFITSSKERVALVREMLLKQLVQDFMTNVESLGYSKQDVLRWMQEELEQTNLNGLNVKNE